MNSIRAATGILLLLSLVVLIPYMLHVDPEQKRSRVLYGTIKKLKDEYTHLNSKISIASKVHDSDYVSSNVKAMKSFVKQKSTVESATEVETFYTLFSQSDGSDEPPGTPRATAPGRRNKIISGGMAGKASLC